MKLVEIVISTNFNNVQSISNIFQSIFNQFQTISIRIPSLCARRNLIVETRIGQLKIDKLQVSSIKEMEPLKANIVFNEMSIEEKISKNN